MGKIRFNGKIAIIAVAFLLFSFFSFTSFAGATDISNPQISLGSVVSSINNALGAAGNSECSQNKDFIVQIAPSGCTPTVVRSDLLEAQDVQVYCPLMATQLNPLIHVSSISGISFSGKYPPGVRSIGFYPAQAALSTNGQQVNYPVLSNIGYVVIDLKQIANESSLTNCTTSTASKLGIPAGQICYYSGNLTAQINYNSNSAFGIGTGSFYLPQMSDSDWQSNYLNYGFWDNRGYLRVENIQGNKATIDVYDSNLNKVSTVTLSQGQTSNSLSIPGFSTCSATMKIKFNGLDAATTRAELDINGNLVQVAQGEQFLNNQCTVDSIYKAGLVQDVKVTCNTDLGSKTFDLTISPKVQVTIGGGTPKDVGIGDYLFTVPLISGQSKPTGNYLTDMFNHLLNPAITATEKFTSSQGIDQGYAVYLGYIGESSLSNALQNPSGTMNLNNVYLYLDVLNKGATPEKSLTSFELSSFATLSNLLTPSQFTQNPTLSLMADAGKLTVGLVAKVTAYFVSGQDLAYVGYGQTNDKLGTKITFNGFTGSYDQPLSPQNVSENYSLANTDYGNVQKNYPSETYPSGSQNTLGEEALYQQMNMSYHLNQLYTLQKLCSQFKSAYPKSTMDISFCGNTAKLSSPTISSQYVTISGQSYLISLDSIYEPSSSQYGAVVDVKDPNGNTNEYNLSKGETVFLQGSTSSSGNFIQLSSVSEDSSGQGSAVLNVKAGVFSSGNLGIKEGVPATLGTATGSSASKDVYIITLKQVNLQQFAQVSLIPNDNDKGSQANFSFDIGVEKRAVLLNPQQTENQIKKINESIAKFEKLSNSTGQLLNTLTTACQYAGTGLSIKTFFTDLTGEGIARTQVMTGVGGWNDKCKTMVAKGQYKSLDDCLSANSDQIDTDVSQMTTLMSKQNTQIKDMQSQYTTSSGLGGVFSTNVVDTNKLMQVYSGNVSNSLSCLSGSITDPSNPKDAPITVSQAQNLMSYTAFTENQYTLDDARNVQLYSQILCSSSSSQSLKNMAQQQLYNTLSGVQAAAKSQAQQQQQTSSSSSSGIKSYPFSTGTLKTIDLTESPVTFADSPYAKSNPNIGIPSGDYVVPVTDNSNGGKTYLLDYGADGAVKGTYAVGTNNQLTRYTTAPSSAKGSTSATQSQSTVNPFGLIVKIYTPSTYSHAYKDPTVQYFATAPYQNMPAVVPFDLKNGWYAAIKQTAPNVGNNINSYDASGRVNSFYLCNVGPNGIEEFNSGIGDDTCESMNIGTGQTYDQFPGLDSSQTSTLVNEAVKAIQQAAQQYQAGVSQVVINGQSIKVGTPATNTPAMQCQDFMSPKDCDILFNLCDPVVCPSSRCNFGGAYPVSDVVQTGIVGSIMLCLPNFKGFGGTDVIPVCLTGVQAGLQNWIQIQKSYASCLQNNLNTGETTGICSAMYDVYTCNFWWQEAAPLAKLAGPKLLEVASGQNTQGGGEYLNVQNAIKNAQQSASYIANTYASSSTKAFQEESTKGLGGTFCGNFISTVFPTQASLFNSLGTHDSPPQYTGSFQTIPYTTATVPPQSQYKVFYNIYAGNNSGVYYSVYLKGSGTSYYQDTSAQRTVASGYINQGASAQADPTFTAPSGYNQMCISVNGQTNCGFQQVSTSLAINYIQSSYVASQVNNTDITSSSDCVSGTPSLGGLSTSLNVQQGISNSQNPQIYNQGIQRVCSTSNPAQATDPNAGTANAQWVKVGYCDNPKVGCWLDTQGISNILNSPDLAAYVESGFQNTTTVANVTLQSVSSAYMKILSSSGQYLTNDQFDSAVQDILNSGNPNQQIIEVNNVLGKVLYNNQKGELLFLRGNAYSALALGAYKEVNANKPSTSNQAPGSGTAPTTNPTTSSTSCGYSSYSECVSTLQSNGNTNQQQIDSICGSCSGAPSSGAATTSSATTSGGSGAATTSGSSNSGVSGSGANGGSTNANSGTTSSPGSLTTSQVSESEILSAMQSNSNCQCGPNCANYAQSVWNAANQYNEDPLLLVAIMIEESKCQELTTSGTQLDSGSQGGITTGGTSYGLMQIDSSTVSDCTSPQLGNIDSSPQNIYNNVNDENVKCGAYILNEKHTSYGSGQSYTFPMSGFAKCNNGFTASYSGWDAAIRGYNGWGCPTGTNTNYVSDVDGYWKSLATSVVPSLVSGSSGGATTQTCGGFTTYTDCINAYGGSSTLCSSCPTATANTGSTSTAASQIFSYAGYYLIYSGSGWHWSKNGEAPWNPASYVKGLSGNILNAVTNLQGANSYEEGLTILVNSVAASSQNYVWFVPTGNYPVLSNDTNIGDVSVDHNGQFQVMLISTSKSSHSWTFDFKYTNGQWEWHLDGSPDPWYPVTNVAAGQNYQDVPTSLIQSLQGENQISGAMTIFGINQNS